MPTIEISEEDLHLLIGLVTEAKAAAQQQHFHLPFLALQASKMAGLHKRLIVAATATSAIS
jgi:hypothetical protein